MAAVEEEAMSLTTNLRNIESRICRPHINLYCNVFCMLDNDVLYTEYHNEKK